MKRLIRGILLGLLIVSAPGCSPRLPAPSPSPSSSEAAALPAKPSPSSSASASPASDGSMPASSVPPAGTPAPTDPASAAQDWLAAIYSGLGASVDAIPDDPAALRTKADLTACRPDIFSVFPKGNGDPDDIAFLNARASSGEPAPHASAVLLSASDTRASVRLTDPSDADPNRLASLRLNLERTAGTRTAWRVTDVRPETCTAFCLAEDRNNVMRLTRTPVFLSKEEAESGFRPLLSLMAQKTGIEVMSVRLDGNRVLADLPEKMRLYLNQGSTGSTMRVNTLVRTLLTLPGVAGVRVTIAGEPDVEMDHYSFKGVYRLDGEDQLQLAADPCPVEPKTAEDTAALLFTALAGRQWDTLARFADPMDGVTMGLYGFLEDFPVRWTRMDWLSIPWDGRRKDFGFYDGSGFPIRVSAEEWLSDFFVPAAPRSGWTFETETGDGGHTGDRSLPSGRWPEAVRVTCRWPGTTRYDGMDWRTLTFVLHRSGSGWRLVGLISNQWTI